MIRQGLRLSVHVHSRFSDQRLSRLTLFGGAVRAVGTAGTGTPPDALGGLPFKISWAYDFTRAASMTPARNKTCTILYPPYTSYR